MSEHRTKTLPSAATITELPAEDNQGPALRYEQEGQELVIRLHHDTGKRNFWKTLEAGRIILYSFTLEEAINAAERRTRKAIESPRQQRLRQAEDLKQQSFRQAQEEMDQIFG